jgi:hypothetical protein
MSLSAAEQVRRDANLARYRPGQRAGHYESYFIRANHASRPLAFWFRYTVFAPNRQPERARGELWAVVFDGERGAHAVAKRELPIARCAFGRERFGVAVGDATLDLDRAAGRIAAAPSSLAWDLRLTGGEAPLLPLAPLLYAARLPRAKTLVPRPGLHFSGAIEVDGRRIEVDDWLGSQNHNWGSRHTDHYAWGQVVGFDGAPNSVLEVATARIRLGPFWTPFMTFVALRHEGEEIALGTLGQALRARGRFAYFDWEFASENSAFSIAGGIRARRGDFVGLRYDNPPGGSKHCLNTKIAACELRLVEKRRGTRRARELSTRNHAAFEILCDDRDHGIRISA